MLPAKSVTKNPAQATLGRGTLESRRSQSVVPLASLFQRCEQSLFCGGRVRGAQFGLRSALRQAVGDVAAFELDPRQEVTFSVTLEDKRVMRGVLFALRLRRWGQQGHLCLAVANHQSLAGHGDRLDAVCAGR